MLPLMPGRIQSIERAAAILRLLAGSPGQLGLMEIANALGLAKGTAHGIIRTLQGVGFIEQEPLTGKYQLGATLLHLGSSYLDANELRSRAINWCDSLAAHTKAAVRIGTLLQGHVLVVHHVFRPDDSIQVLDVGSLLPLHACALGKVLLAYDPAAMAALPNDGLESYTWRTVVKRRALLRALAVVRERGWAEEVEEMTTGQAGIAAAIHDHGGLVVGAVGITGSLTDICNGRAHPDPALAAQVRDAARAISRELGGRR
jgi:DNA-binding IclR family transcriptional regulator